MLPAAGMTPQQYEEASSEPIEKKEEQVAGHVVAEPSVDVDYPEVLHFAVHQRKV